MVIGHFAIGLIGKKFAPKTSLALLISSAISLDILWILFLILGIERVEFLPDQTAFIPVRFASYPYSHSLFAAIFWGALFAFIYQKLTKYAAGSIFIGCSVLSHWFLDLIVHEPDLHIFPGGTFTVGFHLWQYEATSLIVESLLFFTGVFIYDRMTQPLDRIGHYGFWTFVLILAGLYFGRPIGLPIGNLAALVIFGIAIFLSVPVAAGIDKHRQNRP